MQDGTKYRKAFAEQVRRIREDLGLDYETRYGGEGPTPWDSKQLCDHYVVTFRKIPDIRNVVGKMGPPAFTAPYYQGIGNRACPRNRAGEDAVAIPMPPPPFNVLASLKMDDPHGASFEDWCAEYAYDTDSRRALEVYLTCQRQTQAFKRAFPNVDLDTYEPLENY